MCHAHSAVLTDLRFTSVPGMKHSFRATLIQGRIPPRDSVLLNLRAFS